VIVMTAHSDLDHAVAAYRGGAFEYLPKPFDIDEAVALVKRAATQGGQGRGVEASPAAIPGILGQAPPMQEVFRAIGRLSRSSLSVLVTGESGTGKELVARALHQHSPRAAGPFIALNTSAIASELLESELFGHERGAFTGADAMRRGRFEQADGGTLFLDEIGDMSTALQTRLLRVLAEGEFYRVGGSVPIRVDVRVIAATHQDLDARVKQGRFREDLLHRLNVIRIRVPSLRERRDDIPELVGHFLNMYNERNDRYVVHIDPKALDALQSYHWPGNVRELQNYIERAVVMAPGDELTPDLLPETMQGNGATTIRSPRFKGTDLETLTFELVQQGLTTAAPGETNMHSKIVDRVERELIVQVLASCDNVQIKAAAKLGINRNTLHKKLKDYGLEEES
jgi:two-component system nitrogen regulation response regulator GlnG